MNKRTKEAEEYWLRDSRDFFGVDTYLKINPEADMYPGWLLYIKMASCRYIDPIYRARAQRNVELSNLKQYLQKTQEALFDYYLFDLEEQKEYEILTGEMRIDISVN